MSIKLKKAIKYIENTTGKKVILAEDIDGFVDDEKEKELNKRLQKQRLPKNYRVLNDLEVKINNTYGWFKYLFLVSDFEKMLKELNIQYSFKYRGNPIVSIMAFEEGSLMVTGLNNVIDPGNDSQSDFTIPCYSPYETQNEMVKKVLALYKYLNTNASAFESKAINSLERINKVITAFINNKFGKLAEFPSTVEFNDVATSQGISIENSLTKDEIREIIKKAPNYHIMINKQYDKMIVLNTGRLTN